jgi:catechol 2,3-dioxygenase-like lactoylglutathione lyase family enzyme
MLHHISFGVADLDRSARFYDAALRALGYRRVWSQTAPGEQSPAVGYGREGGEDRFAIKLAHGMKSACGPGFHLAFAAPSRDAVDAFHREALTAGGADNGGPGLRRGYGPNYYAAFVLDPDGYRLEAVFDDAVA